MARFAGALWRHPDFLRLWTAQTVSQAGARITREGLPLAALLTIDASPAELGALAACATAPQILVGLVAGGYVDRAPRRALMIRADLARAVLVATIPLAAALGGLSIWHLYGVAALVGAASVLFDLADHAFLPSLIDRADLAEGNAKLAATDSLAEIAGPALAGLLVQIFSAPLAILFNAATYVLSALALMRIEQREPARPSDPAPGPDAPAQDAPAPDAPTLDAPSPGARLLGDITDGFGAVLGDPLVRPLLFMNVTMALFGGVFGALYVYYALKTLALTPFQLGLTIAAGGVGALFGALASPLVTRALGAGPAILTSAALAGLATLAIPLASGTPEAPSAPFVAMAILVGAQLCGDACATSAQIGAVTLRQSALSNAVMGRAGGAFQVGVGAAALVGALGGGLLGETIGPRAALLIGACGLIMATLWGLFSPLRTLRALPEAGESTLLEEQKNR